MSTTMFGRRLPLALALLVSGVLLTTSTTAQADDGVLETPTCAAYASSVGVSLYCLSGAASTGGIVKTLRQLYPGQSFDPCLLNPIPAGMRAPNDHPRGTGHYYLRSCLSNVNLDTVDGGDIRVTLSFFWVENGGPVHDYANATPLEKALWAQVEEGKYPIPFATAWPTHVPRVNGYTFFQFRWLFLRPDGTTTVAHAPGSSGADGDPYLQLSSGGVTVTAQSTKVVLDPLVDGMSPQDCGANPPAYDQTAAPDPRVQPSSCYVRFLHSSAAAPELSTVPLPKRSADYPVPMYVLQVNVTWHVTMQLPDGTVQTVGDPVFTANQEIPVTEVPSYVGSEN